MSGNVTTEVFFRAEPFGSDTTTIPAQLYNRCRLMQSRCTNKHMFVPIRTMQYLAVVDEHEVIFVDSQAYTVSAGEGGRMIMLSWHFSQGANRDSLDQPVPMEVYYHHPEGQEAQKRMIVEFDHALQDLEQRMSKEGCDPKLKKVIPFPGT
jgi:hypothetical protein